MSTYTPQGEGKRWGRIAAEAGSKRRDGAKATHSNTRCSDQRTALEQQGKAPVRGTPAPRPHGVHRDAGVRGGMMLSGGKPEQQDDRQKTSYTCHGKRSSSAVRGWQVAAAAPAHGAFFRKLIGVGGDMRAEHRLPRCIDAPMSAKTTPALTPRTKCARPATVERQDGKRDRERQKMLHH